MTSDRKKAQLDPVGDPANLTYWWGMPFAEPFYCYKVKVVGRRAGANGEDFLSFELVGDAVQTRPPPKGPFEVDLNAGGALVWPYPPSTAQRVTDPNGPAPYGYLFVNQTWASGVGISDARYYAEGGGTGGGKWPLAAG
jgi:hypothetical protein